MNKVMGSHAAIVLAMALLASGSLQAADDDAAMQRKLRAMAAADTDWHPDLAGEFNGLRYYAHGDFGSAIAQFVSGAYYADKLSQLSIGLMYLNGEGLAKDPVAAYAWVDLAAERGYADYLATRDRIKASLDEAQLHQADALRAQLGRVFADEVAKPRLARQLRWGMENSFTGSRVGFDYGADDGFTYVYAGHSADHIRQCSGPTISLGYITAPITGCGGGQRFSPAFWDPNKYFVSRDAVWKAEVTVGPLKEEKAAASSSSQPQ